MYAITGSAGRQAEARRCPCASLGFGGSFRLRSRRFALRDFERRRGDWNDSRHGRISAEHGHGTAVSHRPEMFAETTPIVGEPYRIRSNRRFRTLARLIVKLVAGRPPAAENLIRSTREP